MKVDVYDTYATSPKGETIHFDVLVQTKTSPETAFEYARQWLASVGLHNATLKQSRCNFCHSENARQETVEDIEKIGYHIIQMEGCPDPK